VLDSETIPRFDVMDVMESAVAGRDHLLQMLMAVHGPARRSIAAQLIPATQEPASVAAEVNFRPYAEADLAGL
jgi:hypothetical protein